MFDGSVGVVDDDGMSFIVEFKEVFLGIFGLVERIDGKEFDGKSFISFDGNDYFFIDCGFGEEELSRYDII